jgi:hypothetical protein
VKKKLIAKKKELKSMNDCFPAAIVPDGYEGKVLLVAVGGVGIRDTIVLRSGDIWHSEILRATEVEIKKLGVKEARVHEAGGAWVRVVKGGAILIYGTSEEFGACDKSLAAGLLRQLFPKKNVYVDDYLN